MRSKAFVLTSLCIVLAGHLALPAPARGALRVPQVPVLGSGLQSYLDLHGEFLHVNTDQDARQEWASNVSNNATFSIQVELGSKSPDVAVGVYNANDAAPALYELFPPEATAGWFAVGSFRSAPVRLVVNLFDDNAAIRSTTTYLGANKNDFGYYLSGTNGSFYTQDARNPGATPQVLVFNGTGINSGSWWLAFEDAPLAGGASDQDFDDTILFFDAPTCACPAQKCSWGALKSRFR